MRAKLFLLVALCAAGCSTVAPEGRAVSPPPDNASAAEWDAYAAAKRDQTVPSAYPAWTYPASVLAKLASGGVSLFSR